MFLGTPHSTNALPPPEAETQHGKASPSPTPARTPGTVLPIGSDIYFILDEELSSAKSKPGTLVKAHLKDALIVNGVTLAPAGTPAFIAVIGTRHKGISEREGIIQVHFEPLELPGIGALPIRAIHEYLSIEMSGGQVATQDAADAVGDIFVPYYTFFQIFRTGHDFVLPAGAQFRAETAAGIDATNRNAVVIATPPPLVTNFDPPHADYRPPPIYTIAPTKPPPTRKPKPTPTPSPPPTDTPSPSPVASASPTPTSSPSGPGGGVFLPSPGPSASPAAGTAGSSPAPAASPTAAPPIPAPPTGSPKPPT